MDPIKKGLGQGGPKEHEGGPKEHEGGPKEHEGAYNEKRASHLFWARQPEQGTGDRRSLGGRQESGPLLIGLLDFSIGENGMVKEHGTQMEVMNHLVRVGMDTKESLKGVSGPLVTGNGKTWRG